MTTDTVGGVWTYAIELARELCGRGSRVLLASMGGPLDGDQASDVAGVDGLEAVVSGYRLEWMEDPWDDVDEAGRWLLDLEAAFAPDVVHLNGFAHGSLPWRAPVLMVGHSCVSSWWWAVKGEGTPPEWSEYRRRVRRGLARADLVVAPTAAMMAELDRHHGPLARTAVIPNGRDPGLFRPEAEEPLVLSAGRLWDEAKNVAVLERVAERIPWPIYLAGEANRDGGGDGAGRAQPLGLLGKEELARWMGRAAIYVHPARYEPFGLACLEAALSGCALVLGDIDSLREVWGDAATFVDPGDERAVEAGIRRLVDDPPLRQDLRTRAYERALELSPSAMADAYRVRYAELTRRKVAA